MEAECERKTGVYSIKEKEQEWGGGDLEWGQDSLKLGRGVGGDGARRTFLKETASGLAFRRTGRDTCRLSRLTARRDTGL